MRIGYDRDKIGEYASKYGAVIIVEGKEEAAALPVDGREAFAGLMETVKGAGINIISVIGDAQAQAQGEPTPAIIPTNGYFIIPADYPLISVNILRTMMDALDKTDGTKTAAAAYEGKKGQPVYVPAADLEAALAQAPAAQLRIPVNEEGCLLSSATPEGYADIRSFVARGFSREKLEILTARKRVILTPETGAPAEAIVEAISEDIHAELLGMDKFGKEPMPAIERIYCGDTEDAKASAAAICQAVNNKMKASGSRQTVDFKVLEGIGPCAGGEDIFDMQYRVMGAFRELLRNDDAKDIIITANEDALKVIHNNIEDLRVNDDWAGIPAGEFTMQEPFPLPVSERTADEEKPMSIQDMTMEDILKYYE